jgi:hypothetical protein
MITGRIRATAPFFNKEHEHFTCIIEDYSFIIDEYFKQRPEIEFFYPWEDPDFHLDAFIDVLYGAYYVSQKLQNPQFDYPKDLAWHFTQLFPDDIAFAEALNERLSTIDKILERQLQSSPDKQTILNSYNKLKEQLNPLISLLSYVVKSSTLKYIKPAITFTEIINKKAFRYYSSTRFTPTEVIKYNYHNQNKNESWLKYPFSFFINLLLHDGVKILNVDYYEYCEWQQENSIGFEEFTKERLDIEALRSATYLIQNLKANTLDFRQQLSNVCQELNDLYDLCSKHRWSDENLQAFSIIEYTISKAFPKKGIRKLITFPLQKIYNSPFIKTAFLSRILKTPIQDREHYTCFIFDPQVTPDQFRNLILGNYFALP